MSAADPISAARATLRDVENNLASCFAALNLAKSQRGGVPNTEVLALAQVQATAAQAYAILAVAEAIAQASAAHRSPS